MTKIKEQIEELLEIGCHMGSGERYLMLYKGSLAITNRTGLTHWPKGNRLMIAMLDTMDCISGLTPRQWTTILGKLGKLRGGSMLNRHGSDFENQGTERVPKEHPT